MSKNFSLGNFSFYWFYIIIQLGSDVRVEREDLGISIIRINESFDV